MVVLPTPPFGANTETTRVAPTSSRRGELLADAGDAVHQVEAGERHRQHGVHASLRVDVDRVLGHGQHDDRHLEARLVDLLGELRTLDPTLQQGVDEHDVGSQLADLGERLAAVGDDVEELDARSGC